MSVISEEDLCPKTEKKEPPLKLDQSLDSSNNSQNEEIYFSSNHLIMKTDFATKSAQPKSEYNKIKFFDSEDDYQFSDLKKNLFASEINNKLDKNKNSEAKSTEPTSLKIKNYNTPTKKYSIIKLIKKDKKYKKNKNSFGNKKEEKEIINEKKERTDIYGNIISKNNKKNVKVSFIDKVTTQPLVNVIPIECFRNYNYIDGMPKEEKTDKKANCQCCITF
jgi:hypothetical protein